MSTDGPNEATEEISSAPVAESGRPNWRRRVLIAAISLVSASALIVAVSIAFTVKEHVDGSEARTMTELCRQSVLDKIEPATNVRWDDVEAELVVVEKSDTDGASEEPNASKTRGFTAGGRVAYRDAEDKRQHKTILCLVTVEGDSEPEAAVAVF